MTKLLNNAEGGTNGTTVTTGNSGGSSGDAFDVVTIGASDTLTFDNAHAAHGSLSYKFISGSTSAVVLVWSTSLTGSSLTQVWWRAYYYATSHSMAIKIVEALSGSTQRAAVSINTSGKIILQNAAGTTISTSSTTLPTSAWVRLEGFFIGSATVGQIECKIFTTSADEFTPDETLTTSAAQNTGGTITKIQFGDSSPSAPFTNWMDDLGVSDTAYIGSAVKDIFTGSINLKKMVIAGAGHLKPIGTGTIKLKKMVLSGTSHEKTAITGTIALKKMKFSSSFFGFGTTRQIVWDTGNPAYFQGVSNGVLYPRNSPGVAWNGLISVTEKSDPKSTSLYIDGQLYRNRNVPDAFTGTISAYTYPDELEPYTGVANGITAQPKNTFSMTFRDNRELHLVYNVLLGPSNDEYSSVGDSVNPLAFQWDFTTLPANIPGGRPSAHLVIMIDYAQPEALAALEAILYGDDANAPSMPTPQAVYDLFMTYAAMIITDNGDGTWTADGPDDAITLVSDIFTINWPSATYLDTDKYSIRTL